MHQFEVSTVIYNSKKYWKPVELKKIIMAEPNANYEAWREKLMITFTSLVNKRVFGLLAFIFSFWR